MLVGACCVTPVGLVMYYSSPNTKTQLKLWRVEADGRSAIGRLRAIGQVCGVPNYSASAPGNPNLGMNINLATGRRPSVYGYA